MSGTVADNSGWVWLLVGPITAQWAKLGIQGELSKKANSRHIFIVKLQVLGLRLGVDFTFTLDNNHNNNDNDNDNNNNPHLNFFKGTVLGVKEQGLGIRDKR